MSDPATAPDMVELGAMALFDDNPVWHLVHDRPALWGEVVDSAKERYQQQARAVLDAISEVQDDLALWSRIEQAINATAISRSAANELWGEPCHRKQCSGRHGNPQELFDLVIKQVRESVYVELLCKAISDPDLGDRP